MAIRDILLPLVDYPKTPAPAAIRKCAEIGGYIGAHISALGVDVDVPVSSIPFGVAEHVAVVETAVHRSDAEQLLRTFSAAAGEAEVRNDRAIVRYAAEDVPSRLADGAKLKDLSLLPVRASDDAAERILEALIFASGRPILICPEETADELSSCFDHAAIAWDNSVQAARAMAEALPLLQMAKRIRIFTATDRTTARQVETGAALVKHLAEHGVQAVFETVQIDGRSMGKVFDGYVKANRIDLLVMGAYGHSRLKELAWGGATNSILESPPCWVLMSH
jgi:nucleotide-binding universal stress UspA family protein